MAGSVKDAKVSIRRREMPCCYLDRDTSLLLFLGLIHEISKLKSRLVVNFS